MNKQTDPSRLTEFIFNCGTFYGAMTRDDIRAWLLEQGLSHEQYKALKEATEALITVFYKDR